MTLMQEHIADFDRDGYVLVPGVFSSDEVDGMLAAVDTQRVASSRVNLPDSDGRTSSLSIWFELPDDALGDASRDPRIVNGIRALLREDVLHFHSKVMLKEPRVGGQWEWHQDYGYWYDQGFLTPSMGSAMVALDRATKENGCLKVLAGSHRLGRLDHGKVGAQTGADPGRIDEVEQMLETRYLEAEPGSVVFFHCNLLHASEPNLSERPRRAYICCYSGVSNRVLDGRGARLTQV